MKSLTRLIMLLMLICLYKIDFAQSVQPVSASSTVTAVISTPLAISTTTDMNFGIVAVGVSIGTVILPPQGNRSATGSCQLSPANSGTTSPAAFAITGQGNYTYSITLPSSATTITGTGASMTVDTFVSKPNSTGTLTSGAQTITVGGTLHVSGSQTPGTYTLAAGLTVAVIYN